MEKFADYATARNAFDMRGNRWGILQQVNGGFVLFTDIATCLANTTRS